MEYRKLGGSALQVTTLALGTWAFSGDKWWGRQDDLASRKTRDGEYLPANYYRLTAPEQAGTIKTCD